MSQNEWDLDMSDGEEGEGTRRNPRRQRERRESVYSEGRSSQGSGGPTAEDKGKDGNLRPPELKSNDPIEVKKWIRRVEMWRLDTKCPKDRQGLRLAQAIAITEGQEILEAFTVEELATEDAGDMVLAAIADSLTFADRDTMFRDFDKLLEFPGRSKGQRMASFLSELGAKFIQAERHMESKFPEEWRVYFTLKKANLARRDIRSMLGSLGEKWDKNKVHSSLRSYWRS